MSIIRKEVMRDYQFICGGLFNFEANSTENQDARLQTRCPFPNFGCMQGYTLLETLMVLVLAGLLAGFAIPRLASMFTSIQSASERDDVLNQIGKLGYAAYASGLGFELMEFPNSTGGIPLEIPSDWQIKADFPIVYRSSGVCLGGFLTLFYNSDVHLRVHLRPPHCIPEIK